MKHFCLLLLAFLVFQFPVGSQDLHVIDSLTALAPLIEPEVRATVYEEISLEIAKVDHDLGVAYADSAVLFAELFNDTKEILRIYITAGRVYQAAVMDQIAMDFRV